MILKRRTKQPIGDKLRNMLWPDMGFGRTFHYYKHRILRVGDSGPSIARAVAIGVSMSFSPFLGLHNLLALAFAWACRANIPVAILVTNIFGNPFMVGFFVAATFWVGHLIAGGGDDTALTLAAIEADPMILFGPPMAGWAVTGLVSGIVSYRLALVAFTRYHHRRQKKLQARAHRVAAS